MNKRVHGNGWRPLVLEHNLALIFTLLGLLLVGLIVLYWTAVLEPALRADAESRAQAIAQAQARGVESLLSRDLSGSELASELTTALDAMLLLRDETHGEPLTRQITLQLDPETINIPEHGRVLARGQERCPDCFVSELPLYHPDTRMLIGIARFQMSSWSLHELLRDVRRKLLWGGGAMLFLIAAAWIGASTLLRRLAESEANVRKLLEVSPFPMMLVTQDQASISLANEAAKTYLALETIGGRLDSPSWRSLTASGLPSDEKAQIEVELRLSDGKAHWAIVSVMRVRLSGVRYKLASLVDITELKATQQRLHDAAITDGLTGLYNRRYLYDRLAHEIERADRTHCPLSVILMDLDHFKSINDSYGHATGDHVLVRLAQTLSRSVRAIDICGRYGGEEFLLILPSTSEATAVEVAERIGDEIRQLKWAETELRVTASAGVCEYTGAALDSLLEIADRRLYEAKREGRDRVISGLQEPTDPG